MREITNNQSLIVLRKTFINNQLVVGTSHRVYRVTRLLEAFFVNSVDCIKSTQTI